MEGSIITWKETLSFPLFFLGALGALAATPLLTYIWKQNLTNLKNIVEQHS